jgi:hypothetical protein
MTDELIGTLDGTATDMKASSPDWTVIEPLRVFFQIAGSLFDQLRRFRRGWLHPFHAGNDIALLLQEKPQK